MRTIHFSNQMTRAERAEIINKKMRALRVKKIANNLLLTLMLLLAITLNALGNAKQYKFTNKTDQKATDLHIEFNKAVTFHPNPADPGTPIQDPPGTFKEASGSGSTTVNLAAGVTGSGVDTGDAVVLTFDWGGGSKPPQIKRAYWTKGNTLRPGRDDRLGGALRFDDAENTWVMNPATGNGQYLVIIDHTPYFFHTTPGDDGVITAMKFAAFIDSLPFGQLLEIQGNTVRYTGNAYGDGPNIIMEVLQQDITQPVQVQMLPHPVAPDFLAAQQIGKSSVRLHWQPDSLADHYEIRGRRLNNSNWMTLNVPASSGGMKTVNGLNPGESYIWQVATAYDPNKQYFSGYSFPDTFRVEQCHAPFLLPPSNVTPTCATLHWQGVLMGSYPPMGYELAGRKAGTSSVKTVIIADGTQTSYQANGLSPGTTYQWSMRTICNIPGSSAIFKSDYTPVSTFSTPSNGSASKLAGDGYPFEDGKSKLSDVRIYPNPAREQSNVSFRGKRDEPVIIELLDLTGRMVQQHHAKPESGHQEVKLTLDELGSGLYQVIIRSGDTQEMRKLSIVK